MHEVMGAQSAGFLFFAGGSGECSDLCAEDACELNRNVAESADSNDADARRRVDAVVSQRAVDGDSSAEQGSGLFAGQGIGDTHNEAGVGTHAICVSAIAMDASGFHRSAEIFEAAA